MRLGRAAPLHHAPLPVTDPSRIAAALQRRRAAAGRVFMQAGSAHVRSRPSSCPRLGLVLGVTGVHKAGGVHLHLLHIN